VFALVKVEEPGTMAGLKNGAETAHTLGCGCKDQNDVGSCYTSEYVENYGAIPGGFYNESDNKTIKREDSFLCTALYHSKSIQGPTTATHDEKPRTNTLFVADIEEFTLSINHNVEQSTFGYTASSQSMKGWLQVDADTPEADQLCKDNNGVEVYSTSSPFGFNGTGSSKDSAPCMILPKQDRNNQDYFTVKTLLTAAGVSLDSISQGTSHSVRYRGAKIVIFIKYMNSVPFKGTSSSSDDNNGGITYIYQLQALNSQTSVQDMSWTGTNYPLERLLLQRSGILFTAVQTGQVAKFDFATLILTITTSLTFLTVRRTTEFCWRK
jgi:hypothetical protein